MTFIHGSEAVIIRQLAPGGLPFPLGAVGRSSPVITSMAYAALLQG
jgi:hypothetical protein